MTSDDFIKLKEEIFKDIRSRENSLQEQLLIKTTSLEETSSDLVSQINKINDTIKNISEKLMTQSIKNQKLDEYVGFKNKIESFTLNHEIKIKGILDEISKIKTKYDKIILDNIFVPGLVGPSCQYKTLGDFTASRINEAAKTKVEREQMKKDFKDYKAKVDTFIKNVVTLIDNSVIRANEYAESRVRHVKEFVEMKIYEFDKINTNLRDEIIEKQKKYDEGMEKAKNDFEQINLIKNELDDLLKNKTEDFGKLEIELKTTTENYLKNFFKIKNHMEKEEKSIKDSLKEAFKMISEIRRKIIEKINSNIRKESTNTCIMNEVEKKPTIRKQMSVFQSPKKNHQGSNKKINTVKKVEFSEKKINKQKEDIENEKINTCKSNDNNKYLIDENDNITSNERESQIVRKPSIRKKKSNVEELYKKIDDNHISFLSDFNSGNLKQIDKNNVINRNENSKQQKINPLRISSTLLETKKTNTNNNNLYNEQKFYNLKKYNVKKNPINPKVLVNDNKVKQKIIDPNYNTLNNHIPNSPKIFALKTYNNGFKNKNRNKINNFKVVSLDKKVYNNINDVYTMTSTESVKKRSIKIDFSAPFTNLLKQYSKDYNHQNELQLAIKVSPAFGSTTYSVCDPMYNNLRSSAKSNKIKEDKTSRVLEAEDIDNETSSNL